MLIAMSRLQHDWPLKMTMMRLLRIPIYPFGHGGVVGNLYIEMT